MLAAGLSFFSLLTLSMAMPRPYVGRRGQNSPPPGFVPLHIPGSTLFGPFSMTLGLISSDVNGLLSKLLEVSNPANPAYGAHLSKDEVGRAAIIVRAN